MTGNSPLHRGKQRDLLHTENTPTKDGLCMGKSLKEDKEEEKMNSQE